MLFVITAAAGTGAPDESVTMPVMLAETWARADGIQDSRIKSAGSVRPRLARFDRPPQRRLSAGESGFTVNK